MIPFIRDGLGYREVQANTISHSLIIEEDLLSFLSDTELNRKAYANLLRTYRGNAQVLLADVMELIQERIASSRNTALYTHCAKAYTQ